MVTTDCYGTWQFQRLNLSCNGKKRALWQVAIAKKSEFPCNGNKGALWQVAMAKEQRGVKATSVLAVLGFLKNCGTTCQVPSQSSALASIWPVQAYPHFYQKAKCMFQGLFFFTSVHIRFFSFALLSTKPLWLMIFLRMVHFICFINCQNIFLKY